MNRFWTWKCSGLWTIFLPRTCTAKRASLITFLVILKELTFSHRLAVLAIIWVTDCHYSNTLTRLIAAFRHFWSYRYEEVHHHCTCNLYSSLQLVFM